MHFKEVNPFSPGKSTSAFEAEEVISDDGVNALARRRIFHCFLKALSSMNL